MRREPREGELDAVHRPFHSPLARSISVSLRLTSAPVSHSTSLLVVLLFVSSLVVYAPLSSSHERTTEGREVKWDERRGEGEHRETDTRRTEPRREIDGRSLTH